MGLDDGSEDLVVFSSFFSSFLHLHLFLLYQTNLIESNTIKSFDNDSIPIYLTAAISSVFGYLPK